MERLARYVNASDKDPFEFMFDHVDFSRRFEED